MTQTATHCSLPNRRVLVFAAVIASALAFVLPADLSAAPGDLYVTNLASNTIDVYSPDGVKSTFASGLNAPQGLVFDQAHDLYVADGGSGNIYKYDAAGNRTVFFTGLVAPVGLAINGKRLFVAESGLNRLITLPLDQAGHPGVSITSEDPILGVAVLGNIRYVTYGTVLDADRRNGGTLHIFDAKTQGVTAVVGGFLRKYEIYVTTEKGDIWQVKPASRRLFTSGLNDPNGTAFLPGVPGDEGGELYVADRGAGAIFKYTADGTQTIFVSDAGMPNFLAFENP